MSHFDWRPSREAQDFCDFTSALIHFRHDCPLLGRDEFLGPEDLKWHSDDWDNAGSKFLAFTLFGKCALASK